jgi:citrate lyase subunit beta/citryl-CoA lyase/(S)-citramalyl-CoA lyase
VPEESGTINPRRSLLFVPGSRPQRFSRAEASGADMVCVDLEDAVIALEKDAARQAALQYFGTERTGTERVLRINPVCSSLGQTDLEALSASDTLPNLVMLPKVESAEEVVQAATALAGRGVGFIAMIESPRGLLNALAIAEAHPSMTALMFGGADFCAELGAEMCWDSMLYARGHLAVVAAAAGLQLIDMPCLAIENPELLAEETRRVRVMGFTTKSAIHPAQIQLIHDQFTPSPEEVERAGRIVEASRVAKGGAVSVDGMMVDRPVVLAAQRTLSIARIPSD